MRGVQLVSQPERLKINSSPSKHMQDFNKKHKIRQTHVTKYISSKDNATFEETVEAA
jgi:hypothetical protein